MSLKESVKLEGMKQEGIGRNRKGVEAGKGIIIDTHQLCSGEGCYFYYH